MCEVCRQLVVQYGVNGGISTGACTMQLTMAMLCCSEDEEQEQTPAERGRSVVKVSSHSSTPSRSCSRTRALVAEPLLQSPALFAQKRSSFFPASAGGMSPRTAVKSPRDIAKSPRASTKSPGVTPTSPRSAVKPPGCAVKSPRLQRLGCKSPVTGNTAYGLSTCSNVASSSQQSPAKAKGLWTGTHISVQHEDSSAGIMSAQKPSASRLPHRHTSVSRPAAVSADAAPVSNRTQKHSDVKPDSILRRVRSTTLSAGATAAPAHQSNVRPALSTRAASAPATKAAGIARLTAPVGPTSGQAQGRASANRSLMHEPTPVQQRLDAPHWQQQEHQQQQAMLARLSEADLHAASRQRESSLDVQHTALPGPTRTHQDLPNRRAQHSEASSSPQDNSSRSHHSTADQLQSHCQQAMQPGSASSHVQILRESPPSTSGGATSLQLQQSMQSVALSQQQQQQSQQSLQQRDHQLLHQHQQSQQHQQSPQHQHTPQHLLAQPDTQRQRPQLSQQHHPQSSQQPQQQQLQQQPAWAGWHADDDAVDLALQKLSVTPHKPPRQQSGNPFAEATPDALSDMPQHEQAETPHASAAVQVSHAVAAPSSATSSAVHGKPGRNGAAAVLHAKSACGDCNGIDAACLDSMESQAEAADREACQRELQVGMQPDFTIHASGISSGASTSTDSFQGLLGDLAATAAVAAVPCQQSHATSVLGSTQRHCS